MKKLILTLLLFAYSPLAHAYLGINVLGGLDFAKITEAGENAYTPTHINFGVTGEYSVLPYLAVESGLKFVQKGAGVRLTVAAVDFDIDAKIKYLQIPLYGKMFFLEGAARPFIYFGPSVGFKIGDSVSLSSNAEGASVTTTQTGVLGGEVKTLNLCFDLGAGARITISPTMAAVLGVGYSMGLTGINNDASGTSSKTRDVEVFAGVNFVL